MPHNMAAQARPVVLHADCLFMYALKHGLQQGSQAMFVCRDFQIALAILVSVHLPACVFLYALKLGLQQGLPGGVGCRDFPIGLAILVSVHLPAEAVVSASGRALQYLACLVQASPAAAFVEALSSSEAEAARLVTRALCACIESAGHLSFA